MSLLKKFLEAGELEYTHKRLGLERVRAVLERLDHPERAYPSVLIAGTNGKGSVARMLEAVMVAAGYPVGLYTSPHVENFSERIRIDGKEVSEPDLNKVLQDFQKKAILTPGGEIPTISAQASTPSPRSAPPTRYEIPDTKYDTLTWFEKVTVLAFEVFRRRRVPLAILEVGLGARLDATNVADPIVSVITAIGHDHREVLGDSLFEIAKEKLAVMRKGKPLILAPMDNKIRTFLSKASRMGGAHPVTPAMPQGNWRKFSYGPFEKLELGLAGRHQMGNAATAIEALVALKKAGFSIKNAHIHRGLREAHLSGRMEIFPGKPTVLLDGAHNEESLGALVSFIEKEFPGRPLTVLLGMMKEKNAQGALNQWEQLKPNFVFTEFLSPRSIKIEQWEHWARFVGGDISFEGREKSQEAFALAKANTPPEGIIVVTGSLYLVGEIKSNERLGPTNR